MDVIIGAGLAGLTAGIDLAKMKRDPGYAYWDCERSYNLKNDPDYLNSCKYRGGIYQIVL